METGESLFVFFMGGSSVAVTLFIRLSFGVVIDADAVLAVWGGLLIGVILMYGFAKVFGK